MSPCWQGKELLRKLLKLAGTDPDGGRIFNALTTFYLHCANSEISQLRRLAWTVHAWRTRSSPAYTPPASATAAPRATAGSSSTSAGSPWLLQPGQPETAITLRMHPEIAGVNQHPQALLTPKSRHSGYSHRPTGWSTGELALIGGGDGGDGDVEGSLQAVRKILVEPS